MDKVKEIFLYVRHISFIAFLIAIIIMFPGFKKYDFGNICLIVSLIYIIATFVLIFINNKKEGTSFFNNFVLSFLHLYICFVAYKYQVLGNYVANVNNNYFSFNFLMISICMFVLSINKIIIANSK